MSSRTHVEVLGVLAEAVGPEKALELYRELWQEAETDMAHKCAPLSRASLPELLAMVSYGGVKQ
jgi:hypothetical protein